MEFMPVGVFASIDAGLGVKLEVVRDLGIKTIQLHTPAKASRTPENAKAFLEKLSEYGITTTVVFLGFEGETYETIARTAETVGFVPEETRQARLQEAREIADFAKLLGVEAIGSHIGFVPHDTASDAYKGMVAAIQEYCDGVGLPWNEEIRIGIADRVRGMGAKIIAAKGKTHYGIATCVCSLADAVLNQRLTIAPVTSTLQGEYGLSGVAISLPSIIGVAGVEQRLEEKWTHHEYEMLEKSAAKMQEAIRIADSVLA